MKQAIKIKKADSNFEREPLTHPFGFKGIYQNEFCFLADLTCPPILVDWNKNVAARLRPMPGLKNIGLLEANGSQNYLRWRELVGYHPFPRGSWIRPEKGCYRLNNDFYQKAGGILRSSRHYLNLFGND